MDAEMGSEQPRPKHAQRDPHGEGPPGRGRKNPSAAWTVAMEASTKMDASENHTATAPQRRQDPRVPRGSIPVRPARKGQPAQDAHEQDVGAVVAQLARVVDEELRAVAKNASPTRGAACRPPGADTARQYVESGHGQDAAHERKQPKRPVASAKHESDQLLHDQRTPTASSASWSSGPSNAASGFSTMFNARQASSSSTGCGLYANWAILTAMPSAMSPHASATSARLREADGSARSVRTRVP